MAQGTYSIFPAALQRLSEPAAQPTGLDSVRVTLVAHDSTIKSVVDEIARQAHLQPVYYNKPQVTKHISVHLVNVGVSEAFAKALQGTGLEARVVSEGEMVVIRNVPASVTAASRSAGGIVTGRVTDSASGAGLGGAAVRIEGSKISAVTSDSGQFSLKNVPPGDQVLMVRLFGYRPATRTVTVVDGERTTVRIAMAPVPTVLSGVVTTATGLQRKVEVGNDITSINVDSVMRVAPITSVTDLLETRVPGLTVLHASGTPGDPARLRLRGAGSVQFNNDPIVIIDGVRVYASQSDPRNMNQAPTVGVPSGTFANGQTIQRQTGGYTAPSPLDQIDPASIETIEVLKGPSATATYGSDAASGVIVITTKHGRAGPTHWNLALADGVNWTPGTWPINYYRFGYDGTGVSGNFSGFCPWYQRDCAVDSVVAFQALNDPRYTVFSHGSNQQASLTVSGGLPTLTYSLSGSGGGDVGMLKLPAIEQQRYDSFYGPIPHYLVRPDNYTTWGVGGSLAALPSPTLRVTLQSSLFTSTQQQSSLDNAILQLAGTYVSPTLLIGPLIQNDVERATSNQLTSTNALSLHWQLAPWLPLDATGGLNTIQRTDNTYIPFGVNVCGAGTASVVVACQGDTTGFYGVGRGTSHDQTLTAGTAIPLTLATLAVGGNVYSQSTTDFSVATDQLAPGVTVPTTFIRSNGTNAPTSQSTFGQSTYGWYVEPRLNVHSRFFVTPGFRLDGGSGGSHSSGSFSGLSAFPKIDLSYVAVDRQGTRPLWGVLTLLRPRLAFGLAGTQPLPQDKLRLFNIGSFNLPVPGSGNNFGSLGSGGGDCQPTLTLDGTTTVPAVCLNALGNTLLRPERTRELEGGVDATLWQGRLSLTYTRYDKTTQDAVLSIPVAPSVAGGWSIEKNIGVIRNTGTELTLNATVLESRALSWNVGANLSNDNSLVVRLNPGQAPICYNSTGSGGPCSGTRIVAGYPLFGEWAVPIASFADANHDGIIEPSEIRYADSVVYVGQPNPKYQFNLNTGLTLFSGRLTANATFAYQNGLTQNNAGACQSGSFALLPNAPNTPPATQAAIVAAGCGVSGQVTQIGLVQTVNTFRFNDLSVNYEVPKAFSTWFRVPRVTLALQGSNLALHTNYRGKDPNVNAFSTVSAGDETVDLGQIPLPRTWWLRVTAGN